MQIAEDDTFSTFWHYRTLGGTLEIESGVIQPGSAEGQTEMVRGGEEKQRNRAGVQQTGLWLRLETWCHPERVPVRWKAGGAREGPASDHFTGASRMFGHSAVLHKHHWSRNPPLPPCQAWSTVLAQTKYMDVCVLDCRCTSTDLCLPVRLMAALVCQCLCMIMFDYVSRRIYINEIEILICVCVGMPARVCVCVCGYMSAYIYLCVRVYMMEEEKGGVWKTGLAQSCCRLNLCGCQRKLWSEESANRAWGMSPETRIIWNPETTAGRHLRGPLLKGRQRPWVHATLPPVQPPPPHTPISRASSVRVPSSTVGHLVMLDALLTPVPASELTLPQFPPEGAIVWTRRPGELHILTFMPQDYSNVHIQEDLIMRHVCSYMCVCYNINCVSETRVSLCEGQVSTALRTWCLFIHMLSWLSHLSAQLLRARSFSAFTQLESS